MAKPRIPNQKKQYQLLNRRLAAYMAAVRRIYGELNSEAARIALSTGYDGKQPFAWKDYPATKARVRKLQERFVSQLGGLIMTGTSDEWKRSNLQQDLIVDKVLKAYHTSREDAANERYYRDNSEALQAFQQRKERGMNLSDKLWDQSQAYREELQDTISAAIERGTDAITLSKQISKYLSDFPAMQRDYKEKYGKASKVQNCEYRSIRLARSEINMAYRSAEQQRWRQLDFVVGYEIKMSGSHPVHDVCDELAGKYPKDFVWNGWHPNCMCYEVPILKTEDEFYSDEDKPSVNEVTDVPDSFKAWCEDNEARISLAQEHDTLPYFLKDNFDRVAPILEQKKMTENIIEQVITPIGAMNEEERALIGSLRDAISGIEGNDAMFAELNARRFILEEFLNHENYSERHDVVMRYVYDINDAIEKIKKGEYRDANRSLGWPFDNILFETDFFGDPYYTVTRHTPAIDGIHLDYTQANRMLGSYGSIYQFMRTTYYDNYDELFAFFGGRDNLEYELARLSENSSVFMAIHGSTLERQVSNGSGRFLNSLESKTGTFKTKGEERAPKERLMFGLDPDADMVTMPKYGFMATRGDMDYEQIVGWGYGECYVEFKPTIKSRATMTYGDSYDSNRINTREGFYTEAAPSVSVREPDAEFLLSIAQNSRRMTLEDIRAMQSFSQLHTPTYVEAQMYGDIRIEDVECIYVEGKKRLASIQKAVENKGLAITVKPCRYDTRLKYMLEPYHGDKAEKYAKSLSHADVDALGDIYINSLCDRFAQPVPFLGWNKEGEFESWWTSTAERIQRGDATMEEKREFLKRFYDELDKKDKGAFIEAWWKGRSPSLGGWTSDVIDGELLRRSE